MNKGSESMETKIRETAGKGTDENLQQFGIVEQVRVSVYEPVGQQHERSRDENENRIDELQPAVIEIAERENADHAGHQMHHKEALAAIGEEQQRDETHYIGRHHHSLLEEGHQVNGYY